MTTDATPYFEDFPAGRVMRTIRRTVAEADMLAFVQLTGLFEELWGMEDRAVPFEDHLELAVRLEGALVPIAGAAHVPFFERPETTLRWLRHAGRVAGWPA